MEKNKDDDYGEEEDSEYVLLDLEAVRGQIDIPPNAPYTLSVSSKFLYVTNLLRFFFFGSYVKIRIYN